MHCKQADWSPSFGPRLIIRCSCCLVRSVHIGCHTLATGEGFEDEAALQQATVMCSEVGALLTLLWGGWVSWVGGSDEACWPGCRGACWASTCAAFAGHLTTPLARIVTLDSAAPLLTPLPSLRTTHVSYAAAQECQKVRSRPEVGHSTIVCVQIGPCSELACRCTNLLCIGPVSDSWQTCPGIYHARTGNKAGWAAA